MKIIFDSEDQIKGFIKYLCVQDVNIPIEACTNNCERCWREYAEIEVEEPSV